VNMLRVDKLAKVYGSGNARQPVFEALGFTVQRGEMVAVVGASGSGKTTLLNLISGMDVPSSGAIRFNDTDLTALSDTDRTLFRRHSIGIIFQSFNLIPTLTVAENILLPLELSGQVASEDRDRALQVLSEVGLESRADSFPDRLSGGEQQRVAIARALVNEPDLILADEPTGNLDSAAGMEIMRIFEELNRSGKTIVLITHDVDLASKASRVVRIVDGKIVEDERAASPAQAPGVEQKLEREFAS